MNKELFVYFVGKWHRGAINRLLHVVGFVFLVYGIAKVNWGLILLSAAIMELGHLYELAQGKHKKYRFRIIPIQIIAWLIPVVVGLWLVQLVKG